METFSPSEEFTIDVSTRIDKLEFDIDGNEIRLMIMVLKVM